MRKLFKKTFYFCCFFREEGNKTRLKPFVLKQVSLAPATVFCRQGSGVGVNTSLQPIRGSSREKTGRC